MHAMLTTLWREGRSASEIASYLNRISDDPITRNSVIGKAHRLGLTGRASPIKSRSTQTMAKRAAKPRKARPARITRPVKVATISEPTRRAFAEPAGGLTLDQVQKVEGCRWPIQVRDVLEKASHFCGAQRERFDLPFVADPAPYCAEHTQRSVTAKANPHAVRLPERVR